jgi:hypothetical protein
MNSKRIGLAFMLAVCIAGIVSYHCCPVNSETVDYK